MSRRWRYPRSRRGDFYTIVPAAVAPSAPSYVPVFQEPSGRNARLAGIRARRARFLVTTTAAPWIPPSVDPARRAPIRPTRRGRFLTVPLVGVAPAAAPWIPPLLDIRRAPSRPVRRGRFYTVPLVGAAPPPAVALPTFTRGRVRVLFARRGHYWSPPYPQQQAPATPWVPPITRARRPQVGPARRGEYLATPLPRATCPGRMASRRSALPMRRRGQMWMPSWVYVPPAPPTSGTAHAATGSAPGAFAAAVSTATASASTGTAPSSSAAPAGAATSSPGSMNTPTSTGA